MTVPQQVPQQQAVEQSAPVEQSVDERISARARGFLQEIEENDDTEQLDEQAAPEVETPTEEVAQEAETPPPPEVPMVEVDIDGEKFTIPEKVKHRVMADKDYRQKTMEVAATKKHLEALTATATQIAQQAQQMAPYHAQLMQMDNHAQMLQQQMQQAQANQDPLAYNEAQGALAILLRNRDQSAQWLHQQTERLNAEQKQLRLQALSLEAPKLFQEFPDLAKPETQQKLAKYVTDSGLPQEALDFLNYSAAGTRLAWKAHQYDVLIAEQAKAKEKLAEKVKGLPSATQSSRAPDKGAQNKQLRDQWRKNGGSINDPAFSAYLRNKLRG